MIAITQVPQRFLEANHGTKIIFYRQGYKELDMRFYPWKVDQYIALEGSSCHLHSYSACKSDRNGLVKIYARHGQACHCILNAGDTHDTSCRAKGRRIADGDLCPLIHKPFGNGSNKDRMGAGQMPSASAGQQIWFQ